jgi:uncharacterized protein with NRDE domain
MCLILLGLNSHPDYKLILAGNRDEYYDRPTAEAAFWDEAPCLLAGKDLLGGGTWFGITRGGRLAAISNYRDPKSVKKGAPSRGRLVSGFLLGNDSPSSYLDAVTGQAGRYNGFNLVAGRKDRLFWYSNRGNGIRELGPGIYGLSNHLMDTPWPKVIKGKSGFAGLISRPVLPGPDDFFHMLADRAVALDMDITDTGGGLERERMLSPIFISSSDYGTRSSTLLFIDRDDLVTFIERTFDRDLSHPSTVRYEFRIEKGNNVHPPSKTY